MRETNDTSVGTEDLERGMRAGHAGSVIVIAVIAIAMLATVNSGGLARWTQSLPSNAANLWIAERAVEWHELMLRLGPAAHYEKLRAKKD